MWLRRLVGIVMIITCIGMNILVVIGFFSHDKTNDNNLAKQTAIAITVTPPTLTISAQPVSLSAGNYSALTWTTTNNPDNCVASESWNGVKTPFGVESTGRINTPGNYNYSMTCSNKGGSTKATVVVAVGPANIVAPQAPKTNSVGSSSSKSVLYCGGRLPCLGPRDVSSHATSGNCWGWLIDRVIDVGAFDSGFHSARSGVGSIQVSGVCGKDLTNAINGGVSTSQNPGHNHMLGAKSNNDANYLGYFVGYFDNNKP